MSEMQNCPDFHYTPENIAKELLKDIKIEKNDIILEPCKGRGDIGFYKYLKGKNCDWCEIDEGRDFFKYDFKGKKYDKIIVNPPYRTNHKDEKDRKNIAWLFMFECFKHIKLDGEVWFLLNNKMFNSLTPLRLSKLNGFNIDFIRILNIKQWYGRYYFICFRKKQTNIKYTL